MGRSFYQLKVELIEKSTESIDLDESTSIANTIGRCRNRPSRPTTHIDRPAIVNTHRANDQDNRPGRIDPSYRPKTVHNEGGNFPEKWKNSGEFEIAYVNYIKYMCACMND